MGRYGGRAGAVGRDVKGHGGNGGARAEEKRNPSRYWLAIDANLEDVAFRSEAEPRSTYCASFLLFALEP